jgi:predicted RND superfamily exporter protein
MALQNIGVDVNTLPVASIAIGIGVDYGIYVYGRIREEFVRLGDVNQAIITAIMTTGKAVTFTVITIVGGVFVWYYSFIRFQADMGLLLTLVTLCHLVGCLFFLPALIVIVKPKFITKR